MSDPHTRCAVDTLMDQGLTHAEARAAVVRYTDDAITKHGWACHIVPDDPEVATGWNVHSHGLAETAGHPDFQITMPLDPETAHGVMIALAEAVQAGRRFAPGDVADGIIRGHIVGFARAWEGGRDVLRCIMPDPEGRLARGEVEGVYRAQYEGTE